MRSFHRELAALTWLILVQACSSVSGNDVTLEASDGSAEAKGLDSSAISEAANDGTLGSESVPEAETKDGGACKSPLRFPGPPDLLSTQFLWDLALADLNGDGRLDVLAAGQNLGRWLNQGDGRFSEQALFAASDSPDRLSVGDLNGDGLADVVASSRGLGSPNGAVHVFLSLGNGELAPAVSYAAGALTWSVALADVNNDGAVDVLAPNDNGDDISVLLNQGDGTLAAHTTYPVGSAPVSAVALDMNGDGLVDIVSANRGRGSPGSVSVLLNQGGGVFGAPWVYDNGVHPYAITGGDFNQDGRPDVAVNDTTAARIAVLLNAGAGTLDPPVDYPVSDIAWSIDAADLNADGYLDLAVGKAESGILFNLGKGLFSEETSFPSEEAHAWVKAGDLEGDGWVDLALVNPGPRTITLVSNAGKGVFRTPARHSVGVSPHELVSGDFDRDGPIDLAVGDQVQGGVRVLRNQGNGELVENGVYAAGAIPTALAVADLNNDQGPDLLVADSKGVRVLLNLPGGFAPAQEYAAEHPLRWMVTADLNGDGAQDVIVGYQGSNSKVPPGGHPPAPPGGAQDYEGGAPLLPDSAPTVDAVSSAPSADGALEDGPAGETDASAESSADSDPDDSGVPEAAPWDAEVLAQHISVYANQGEGALLAPKHYFVDTATQAGAAGDMDGNSTVDVVVVTYSSGALRILWNAGDGTLGPSQPHLLEAHPTSLALADLDSDGDLDIAVASEPSESTTFGGVLSVLLNQGNGTFQSQAPVSVSSVPIAIGISDLNGDGRPDIAVAGAGGGDVSVLLNQGQGLFAERLSYPCGVSAAALVIVDLDEDGRPDIAVANGFGNGSNRVNVLFNRGDVCDP